MHQHALGSRLSAAVLPGPCTDRVPNIVPGGSNELSPRIPNPTRDKAVAYDALRNASRVISPLADRARMSYRAAKGAQ
eukprot:1235818-Heterocapsa_arctica.AAC.1